MKKAKRLILILLILLGPGSIIWFMARSFENYFVELPYLGYTYTYDSTGVANDSVAYNIPHFELNQFGGGIINRDSIRGKFIVLTTIQDDCPDLDSCGLAVYLFDKLFFEKLEENQDNYSNVKVLSILTDHEGKAVPQGPSEKLLESMGEYNRKLWWMTWGDPTPFYNFNYYDQIFNLHLASEKDGEIGKYAFMNSLILIDDKGFIRGLTGARSDSDIRNFFDLLKLLKKEEFNRERGQQQRPQ